MRSQAATALGNLSAHSKFRTLIIDGPALHGLLKCVSSLPKGGAQHDAAHSEQILLPNALAALHNCSLSADAIGFIATEEMADALIPRLETALTTAPGAVAGGSPPVLARRAAGILAKCAARLPTAEPRPHPSEHACAHHGAVASPHRCAARLPTVVERLLGSPVLVALVKALVEEGVSHEAISNAPRIVEIAPGAADAAEEEEQAESAAAAAEEMVRADPRARSDSEMAISEMAISEMAISEMAISEGFGRPGMDL